MYMVHIHIHVFKSLSLYFIYELSIQTSRQMSAGSDAGVQEDI